MQAILHLRMKQFRNDYKILLVMTLLSLVMTAVFAGGSSPQELPRVYLVNQDQTAFSHHLEETLYHDTDYQFQAASMEEALAGVEGSEGRGILVLEKGMGATFETDNTVGATLMVADAGVDLLALEQRVQSVLQQGAMQQRAADLTLQWVGRSNPVVDEDTLRHQVLTAAVENQQPPAHDVSLVWLEESGPVAGFGQPFLGFMVLFSAFTTVYAIASLVEDKELLILRRIKSTPLSRVGMLMGSLVAALLTGLLQLAVMMGLGAGIFGIEWGSQPVWLFGVLSLFILSTTALGLFMTALVNNQSQMNIATPIVLTSFAMLGGCLWPLEIVSSPLLLALSWLTPHRWAMDAAGLLAFQKGEIQGLWLPVGMMLLMAVVFASVGGWMLFKPVPFWISSTGKSERLLQAGNLKQGR